MFPRGSDDASSSELFIHISFSKSTAVCLFPPINTNTLQQLAPFKKKFSKFVFDGRRTALDVAGISSWPAGLCGEKLHGGELCGFNCSKLMDACPCTQGAGCVSQNTGYRRKSTFTCVLFFLTVRCMSYPCAFLHTRAQRRHTFSPFFSSSHFPLTCMRAAAGFADVCPRSASNTGYSHCQCADSDFSTLSYEMRDGDAGALQNP